MFRSARVFVLLLALIWQCVALASPVVNQGQAEDWLHKATHEHGVEHHHHDDGSLHHEDSGSTARHLHCDLDSSPAGLLAADAGSLDVAQSRADLSPLQCAGPLPFLEGLLRPPQPR